MYYRITFELFYIDSLHNKEFQSAVTATILFHFMSDRICSINSKKINVLLSGYFISFIRPFT